MIHKVVRVLTSVAVFLIVFAAALLASGPFGLVLIFALCAQIGAGFIVVISVFALVEATIILPWARTLPRAARGERTLVAAVCGGILPIPLGGLLLPLLTNQSSSDAWQLVTSPALFLIFFHGCVAGLAGAAALSMFLGV